MTTRLWLPVESAILPTTNPATRSQVESAAAAITHAPKVNYNRLVFADATDKYAQWTVPIPADFVAGFPFVLTLWWGSAVNAGNAILEAGVLCSVASSTDLDTLSAFPTSDQFPATAVPATIGQWLKSSLSLTTAAAVAGGLAFVFVGRNGAAAGDTAAGNVEIYAAILEYTSSG